jgi:hypothetical protein
MPFMPFAVALMAMLLALPSIQSGFQTDDWWIRAALLAPPGLEATFPAEKVDIFRIADGNPTRTQQLVDKGMLPWWTPASFKLWFWRPASEWTHRLDYLLWPDAPMLMHLHSILWFGGWVLSASLLFRRLMPIRWVAGLAGVLFALDYGHSLPACWLAARNALLAGLCGTACLLCHDVWRRRKRTVWGCLAALLLGLALLCKESAIGVCAYLLAYAVFLDTGQLRSRATSLIPYAMVVASWHTIYRMVGFGVAGSSMYLDPLDSLWTFLRGVAHRAPILLLSQWALPPAETAWILGPLGRHILWGVAAVLLVSLFYLLYPLLKTDRTARFFFSGMLMSVVPACLGMMSSRQLEFVGWGAAGLLALLFRSLWQNSHTAQSNAKRYSYQAVLIALAVIHLVVSPVTFLMTHRYFVKVTQAQHTALVQETMMSPALEGKTVILLDPPTTSHSTYLLILRALQGKPLPVRIRSLVPGRDQTQPIRVHRLDAYSLMVQVEGGIPVDLTQCGKNAIRPGERIVLVDMAVHIIDPPRKNAPTCLVFEWTEPLESSGFVWFRMQGERYVSWEPPAMGSPGERYP